MKLLFKRVILAGAVLFIAFLPLAGEEGISKEDALSQIIIRVLDNYHYSHQKIDDSFSRKVYQLYIKNLDYNKRFFMKEDIAALQKYENKLDDEYNEGTHEFFTLSTNLLIKRLHEERALAKEILSKPFDFTKNENIEVNAEKRNFAKNSAELKQIWRKQLQYETLNRYLDLSGTNNTKNFVFNPKLEAQARKDVSKILDRTLSRLEKDNDHFLFNRYLNTIAMSFDPHTEYMPPRTKEDFDIQFTGTLEGIGAVLKEDGEYIKVQEIIPGGAAWRQKKLQAGDIILKVAQGSKEAVDIVNMPVDEAVQMIRGKKGTEVRLTIKKIDGRIEVLSIIRDMVVIEESFAKSAVIRDEKIGKTFGYLYLPSFYHNFKQEGSHNSSTDVKKEIDKLKSENVQGIILDLRNNGGGSLDDAIRMSGLFIKKGPIVQVKNSEGEIQVFNDPDEGIEYDGPVIVLINSLSASASEILAAALQDYNRAVIVGSKQSFGKGTVQTFVDLDKSPFYMQFRPLGSLKLTIQKFYRINGGSTQSKGVASDILLPDTYSVLDFGERKMDYSMPWDTIPSQSYDKWDGKRPNLSSLRKNSEARISADKAFQLLNSNIVILQSEYNKPHTLNLSQAFQEQQSMRSLSASLEKIQSNQNLVQAKLTAEDEKRLKDNQDEMKKRMGWLDAVKKDSYIHEAENIMNDWIEQK